MIPGSPSHSDNRIAKVATGEYVIKTAAVNHYGAGIFDMLNTMSLPVHVPAFASGGLVPGGSYSGGGSIGGGITNKITVNPPAVQVSLVQPNTRAAMLEVLKSAEGHVHILDAVVKGKHKLPFKK